MTRRRKDPLRSLTAEERTILEQTARSRSEAASHVARAKMILAVADGATYQRAAEAAGRKSNDAVSQLVSCFNREGLTALAPRHGGGNPVIYGPAERERILTEVRRPPDRERDGTATWSLSTLQMALQRAPDGLPNVSIDTIWRVLCEAAFSWQRNGTWCETGKVKRKRKSGTVEVTDPDTEAKKS
jgi:hypothetical protein